MLRPRWCDGRSHVLSYQAGGSEEQYRVKVARMHHNAAKRARGLLKMQVRRTNVNLLLRCQSRMFDGWAQGENTLTGAREAIKTRTSDDGCFEEGTHISSSVRMFVFVLS